MTDGITPEPEPEPVKQPQLVVTTQPTKSAPDQADSAPSAAPSPATVTRNSPVEEAKVAEATPSNPICKDPRFQMYFDMVKKAS